LGEGITEIRVYRVRGKCKLIFGLYLMKLSMLKRCGNGGGASHLPSSSPWKQKAYSHMDENLHLTTHCSKFTPIKFAKVLTNVGRSFRFFVLKSEVKGTVITI
jgi:hypothetical protein